MGKKGYKCDKYVQAQMLYRSEKLPFSFQGPKSSYSKDPPLDLSFGSKSHNLINFFGINFKSTSNMFL
jgi:hypothetical protein